jgi:hypothetical protein
MKCCAPLLAAALAATPGFSEGQTLIDGTNYPDLFGSPGNVTVSTPIPDGAALGIFIGGTASGNLGNYWNARATGGAVTGSDLLPGLLPEIRTLDSGAQVALTGSGLQFNISNDPDSLLGTLGIGLGLAMTWSATVTFDKENQELLLLPNSVYQVSFDVDGSNGLLKSTLGITPAFGLEMLDGAGNAISCPAVDGSLVNVIGLELLGIIGSPPESGRAVVQFQTGANVPTGPAGLRFTGSALLPATALNLGTNFATISNIGVTAVPEPSALGLGLLGLACAFRRRR